MMKPNTRCGPQPPAPTECPYQAADTRRSGAQEAVKPPERGRRSRSPEVARRTSETAPRGGGHGRGGGKEEALAFFLNRPVRFVFRAAASIARTFRRGEGKRWGEGGCTVRFDKLGRGFSFIPGFIEIGGRSIT